MLNHHLEAHFFHYNFEVIIMRKWKRTAHPVRPPNGEWKSPESKKEWEALDRKDRRRRWLYKSLILVLILIALYAAISLCLSSYGKAVLFARWIYWGLFYGGLVSIFIVCLCLMYSADENIMVLCFLICASQILSLLCVYLERRAMMS